MSGTLKVGSKTLATHDTDTNVSTLTADQANVGSNALVVNSGLVGIGTSSPTSNLEISASTNTGVRLTTTADSTPFLDFRTNGTDRLRISSSSATGATFNVRSNQDMQFYTNNTERMRIDTSGATRFGDTFVGDAWNINSGIFSQLGSSIPFAVASDSTVAVFNRHSTTGTVVEFKQGIGTAVGKIDVTASSTSYLTSSDYRLKENITEITDGISRVKQLNPSRFNFIADPDKTVDGFIAHEVQDIVPEAVSGEKNAVDSDGKPEYQGVDYGRITPLLTAALKEAIEKIEMLEARIAVLEAK